LQDVPHGRALRGRFDHNTIRRQGWLPSMVSDPGRRISILDGVVVRAAGDPHSALEEADALPFVAH